MSNSPHIFLLFTAVALPAMGQQAPQAGAPAVWIIFDTERDSDCGDAGALALLHRLADRGEAEILAIAASSMYRWSISCIEAINRSYGRLDLPIGSPKRDAVDSYGGTKYARAIGESAPTRWKANVDALAVYHQALASQAHGSVTFRPIMLSASKPKEDSNGRLAGFFCGLDCGVDAQFLALRSHGGRRSGIVCRHRRQ